jgi:hypothetical protein
MVLHCPFQHLKHKLWPKEGLGVKLAIWLPTIKSREPTQFLCVQMACNIPLESSRRRVQLCFEPHLNQKSAHKVMAPQSHGGPNLGYRNPTLRECEDEAHTLEMGTWESFGTPETSKFNCRGQDTSHLGHSLYHWKVIEV